MAPLDALDRIEQLVAFGEGPTMRTEMITFDVVDTPYTYNVLLGWYTLNQFGAVPHHNYLCVKMTGPQGLITIHDDQHLARRNKYRHPAPLDSHHMHNMVEDPPPSSVP